MIFGVKNKSPGRAKPEGGYGSGGVPAKAMRETAKKGKPGKDSGKSHKANKPAGGFGTHGKPKPKASTAKVTTGQYGADGMSWPTAKIPTKKSKLFNLPRFKAAP